MSQQKALQFRRAPNGDDMFSLVSPNAPFVYVSTFELQPDDRSPRCCFKRLAKVAWALLPVSRQHTDTFEGQVRPHILPAIQKQGLWIGVLEAGIGTDSIRWPN